MTYQEKADALFEKQKRDWLQLGNNWAKLDEVRLRQFDFNGFSIGVQYNPSRIISSAARVDKASIEKRACFLCPENRPLVQSGVWFGEDYEILCNPFPIFRRHFTLVKTGHTPQVIEPEFNRFLELSQALPDLAVFYNAASCGASAPDHMHFQAGSRGLMPVETEMDSLIQTHGNIVVQKPGLSVIAVADGLRRFLVVDSGSKEKLKDLFSLVYHFVRELQQNREPMINMISYYTDRWRILIFPREKHRPWQYFEDGDKNILLSPASVDMGGALITPLEKDFTKITREDVLDIFSQVSFSAPHFTMLASHLLSES